MHSNNDKTLEYQIKTSIEAYSELDPTEISVSVEEGVATLKGTVDTHIQRVIASDAARVILGVKSVNNELRLRGEGTRSVGEYLDDAMITAGIKTKFLSQKGLSSLKLHVETKDGIVTLSGETDSQEHSVLAGRVARSADGVKKVENHISIAP